MLLNLLKSNTELYYLAMLDKEMAADSFAHQNAPLDKFCFTLLFNCVSVLPAAIAADRCVSRINIWK